jgi:hypothetical protein
MRTIEQRRLECRLELAHALRDRSLGSMHSRVEAAEAGDPTGAEPQAATRQGRRACSGLLGPYTRDSAY